MEMEMETKNLEGQASCQNPFKFKIPNTSMDVFTFSLWFLKMFGKTETETSF